MTGFDININRINELPPLLIILSDQYPYGAATAKHSKLNASMFKNIFMINFLLWGEELSIDRKRINNKKQKTCHFIFKKNNMSNIFLIT
jgi:hypothetical protein